MQSQFLGTARVMLHASRRQNLLFNRLVGHIRRSYKSDHGFDFDTHLFWKELVAKGFSDKQAEVVCETLSEVIGRNNNHLRAMMVNKTEQYKLEEWVRRSIEDNRKEWTQIKGSLDTAIQKQKDDLKRVETNNKLDLSLEKSRVTSEINRMTTMVQTFEVVCKQHTSKVEAELAAVKDKAETKLVNQRWAFGSVMIGGLSVTFAFIRFFIM